MIISAPVQKALQNNRPVVALESTIITHGMPFPQNLAVAKEVEDVVRSTGPTPATIAILDGNLHIGLSEGELDYLAKAQDAAKVSRADMAFVMAQGKTGATTVAATMIAAHAAGIRVFATGGIGGVHRGAENSFDISADLQELAQTPVATVCAGAKAILDLPKTLEVLETLGVPVIAYGQPGLPAFWSRESGLAAPLQADTPALIAKAILQRQSLGLPGGHLIANPIPEENEIPLSEIQPIIEQALLEANAQKVLAKEVTPFLLRRIFELSNGQSLKANIALVKNNAKLAAEIATTLCEIT